MSYSRTNEKAESTAQAIIQAIGHSEPSLRNLREWLMDNFGIKFIVTPTDLSNIPVCGLVYFDPKIKSYRVRVEQTDSTERQRYTVVHEIAHILRERELIYGFFDGDVQNPDLEERFCNRFAAAFLMPEKAFKQKWTSTSSNLLLKRYSIAQHFGVSKETVMYRALELGLS